MLRSLKTTHYFRGIRWNSILASLANDVRMGKPIGRCELRNVLRKESFSASEINHLHEILKQGAEHEIANDVLCHGLPHDFSLYFTAIKKGDLNWADRTLEALIKHNPGRAFSSIELFNRHKGESVSDSVRLIAVSKLLLGEKSEVADSEFVPSDASIVKAISLLNEVSNLSACKNSLEILIEVLVRKNALPVLSLLKLDGLYSWLYSSKLAGEKDREVFLPLSQLIFTHDPTLLSAEDLSKILAMGGTVKDVQSSTLDNFALDEQPLNSKDYFKSVLHYVEQNQLDLDKKNPEALLLRIQLMETYGIDVGDVDLALRKFHEYQSHEKFGLELVQAKLVKAFCYQSSKQENETYKKIAETLLNPEGLAVATVAQLILCTSRFSSEGSLELYNEYINQVSKNINEVTGRSPTGVLTESLMVASLYDNDREFAQLLLEKANSNNFLNDEHEIARIKKVFKAYGEAFVEDSWEAARPIFGQYVLECIKKL
ncbi:hypothetical protein OXX69_006775 [Metschnikowia pulcherrima]